MAYPISDVLRRVVYTGSAGVGPYSFSFEILANTDILVYKNTTLLTLTTNYTVTINANGTGSVTLVVAATGADTITIAGDRAIQRATDFVTGGDLFANTLNDEFDSLVIFSQQIDEKADRALKAPVTDPTSIDMTLPVKASRAGYVLSFNSTTGNPEVTTTVTAINSAATDAANAAASASAASTSASAASASASAASSSASSASASAASALYRTSATGSLNTPVGTTAQRDSPASTGFFRFNTTNTQFEGYNGTAWAGVGGASGGGGNPIVYENDITISVNYTITTNKNAMSAGPLTLNSGITVTVPSGSTWVVL
jgi:hypothetical protein